MGAVIVGLAKAKQEELYQFGIDLGLLFQIQDDIIDETQSEEEAGKTTGNDGDKNSFINLIGLDRSMEEAEMLAQNLEERFNHFDEVLQKALYDMMKHYLYRHRS
jgi:farnesyl diphosphate synthase